MNTIPGQPTAMAAGMPLPTSFEGLVSKNFLPPDFQPGKSDVVIGRGRKSHMSFGNERLHRIVASKLDEYSAATTKTEKSKILSVVVYLIRNEQPTGLFVKQDPSVGLWFDVGDLMAREKVSQAFRDALHGNYRSSNEFKKKRRLEKSASLNSLSQNARKKKLLGGLTTSKNAEWGIKSSPSTKKILPVKSKSTSSLLRTKHRTKPDEFEGVRLNADWKSDEFLRTSLMLDMDIGSSGKIEPSLISKVAPSLPCSSFLAEWFEEDDNVPSLVEPLPFRAISEKDNEDETEALPSTTDFEEFVKTMDIDDPLRMPSQGGEESSKILDSSLSTNPAVLV